MSERRIVIGYVATPTAAHVLAVGVQLARSIGAAVDIVMMLPDVVRGAVVPPDAGYESMVQEQASSWLAEAEAAVPVDVEHRTHVRYADSFAEGLVAAAHEFGAGHIVVGTASDSLLGDFGIGSVANDLLHSSDVAVVLVTADRPEQPAPLSRVTLAIGARPGADNVLVEAAALADAAGVPLRLVSLYALDLPGRLGEGMIERETALHLDRVLEKVQRVFPDTELADIEVLRGRNVGAAVKSLDWRADEVVVVGSSRLASPRRLFFGTTAAKLRREIPVPMIVVPRAGTQQGDPS